MIDGVVIKKLTKYEDDRGWLAEIYRNDETGYRPVMGYVSVTRPGVVRGPHEHKFQSDAFVFVGPGDFDLYLWDRRDSQGSREKSSTKSKPIIIKVGESSPCLVIVPPGVVHGYKCVSDIPAYSINLPDKLYKGEAKKDEIDEIRWEDEKNSPYKIQ